MIESSVGLSTKPNSFEAGKEAIIKALKDLSGPPKLAVVGIDLSAARIHKFEDVLKGIRSVLPNVPLIGGGCVGMIINDEIALRSVGILLLSGDLEVIKPQVFGHSRTQFDKISRQIVNTYKPHLGKTKNQVLLLFTSGYRIPADVLAQQKRFDGFGARVFSSLVSRIFWSNMKSFAQEGKGFPVTQELIEYLVQNYIYCPIIGTQCGDLTGGSAYEIFNDQVYYDSIVTCLLSSEIAKFGVGFDAGVKRTGKILKVTKNVGPFLMGIDGKKALEGLLEKLGYEREALSELSYQGYVNFLSLLGMIDRDKIHPYIAITNPEYDSIFSVLPPKLVEKKLELEICEATGELILQSAKNAVREAKQSVPDPKFLMFFDCSGRLTLLGGRVEDEIEIIRKELGPNVPIFGFGSSGEIKNSSQGGFHLNNMSIVTFVGG
ncbi:MAG: FIST N-terminal domain-containing protein [Candidatus Helarchaeota archaeon]